MHKVISIVFLTGILTACLPSDSEVSSQPSTQELDQALNAALENPKAFQTEIKETCAKFKPCY